MRDAFPYESNGPLLSQFLVPDPIGRGAWEAAVASWEGELSRYSLLEWLVAGGTIGEDALLEGLGRALGVRAVKEYWRRRDGASPEEALLEKQGLLLLEGPQGERWVAGGAVLAPDLSRDTGLLEGVPEWVLLTPVRGAAGEEPEQVEDGGADAGSYGLQGWLADLLSGLASRGAADIHLERTGERLEVRTRESGGMRKVGIWTGERARDTMRLLKTWAGLSTAEEPLPQDGRIEIPVRAGRRHAYRISHLGTVDGECAVLRPFGRVSGVRRLEALGVPAELRQLMVDAVLHRPGMILCTGPTGSGKTTTLYGLLKEIEGRNVKILTIEDPVEDVIEGAVQSAVDEERGWSFGGAVRAFLRQDPDIIFVGEMRDAESAEAACRAALTGHCVLATLHAGSVEAAMDRLRGWGIPEGTLAEAVSLVINQRLEETGSGCPMAARFSWRDTETQEL